MISFTLHLYREGSRWFFDDLRKNIEHEEFVGGVPYLLYTLAGRSNIKKCDIKIDAQEFAGGEELIQLDRLDPQGGTSYFHEKSELEIWLCPVFWSYFRPPFGPKKIWISLQNID